MACRRVAEGERIDDTLRAELPHARLDVLPLDLGDLDSVRAFARAFMQPHRNVGPAESNFCVSHSGCMCAMQRTAAMPMRVAGLWTAYTVDEDSRAAKDTLRG